MPYARNCSPVSSLSRRVLVLSGCLVLGLICSLARGDAASGTYTGSVALRGNYYWERSTRVIAPSAAVSLATPSGVRVEGAYLLDAITSASQATGVVEDAAFTEKRNDVQAGLGYELELGTSQLDLSARGRYSNEPDYLSRGVGFGAALSLDQRDTVLHLNGYFIDDDVSRRDPTPGSTTPTIRVGELRALSLGFSWDQVLNKSSTLTVGYDLARLDGFQANAYRMVKYSDTIGMTQEKHPDARNRHAGYLWFAHYALRSRTTFRLGYRLYYDSWDVLAHAPDVRIHQELGPHVEVRLRYRFYTQSSSFFYRRNGYTQAARYPTDDPKMSDFHDQTLGFKLRVALDFLAFTALDPLRTAVIDYGIEYVFNTNRYGDGIIAQGGLGWAF